jgi:hypothetical protein
MRAQFPIQLQIPGPATRLSHSMSKPAPATLLLLITVLTNAFCWLPCMTAAQSALPDMKTGDARGAVFAFGLSPASGLTLALARRLRDLLAALVGLSWLVLSAGFWKISLAQIPKVAYSKEEITTCKLC